MIRKRISQYKIGAHLSIRGSYLNIFKEAEDLGIYTIACFTGSNLRYDYKKEIPKDLITDFRSYLDRYCVFCHAGYLINIANKNKEENFKKSCLALEAEISRCSQLGISGIAFHPGSNPDRKEGFRAIVETINNLSLLKDSQTSLLIESSAGQGNTLPVFIEEWKAIYENIDDEVREKVGFVIDTCHIFAAGYDISKKNEVEGVIELIDQEIGFDKIKLIHLNDSKKECGSSVDRHESLGKGCIGIEGIFSFITHKKVKNIPKILETPVTTHMDWIEELDMLERIL